MHYARINCFTLYRHFYSWTFNVNFMKLTDYEVFTIGSQLKPVFLDVGPRAAVLGRGAMPGDGEVLRGGAQEPARANPKKPLQRLRHLPTDQCRLSRQRSRK